MGDKKSYCNYLKNMLVSIKQIRSFLAKYASFESIKIMAKGQF